MRRCVLAAAVVAAAALLAPVAAGAATTTRYVSPDGLCGGRTPCYPTIQGAIDDSAAGDVIKVSGGRYHEQVVVDEAVTVTGSGHGTVVDGDGSGIALTVTAGGAIVRRLDVTNADHGLEVSAPSVSIVDVRAYANALYGMFADYGVDGALFQRVEVSGSGATGIDVHPGGSGNVILDAKVHHNEKGIEAYGTTGTVVRNSVVVDNDTTGIQVGWSSDWAITGVKILRNGGNGVLTDTSGAGSVSGNEIRLNGENGIREAGLGNTGSILVSANRIESNALSGIELQIGAAGGLVIGNRVKGNAEYAIEVSDNAVPNGGNVFAGNDLRVPPAGLGCALDDNTTGSANSWRSNVYSCNKPFASPYTIPGLAGAVDASPVP